MNRSPRAPAPAPSATDTRAALDRGLIEVVALHPRDAEEAQAGGAHRLQVCAWQDGQPCSVEPAAASSIVRAVDLPVRVSLRLSGGFSTQGGEFSRLVGLAADYLSLGVSGFSFGFLTADLEVDVDVCTALAQALEDTPWTFDRAFDSALDNRRAWRQVRQLDGCDGLHTAGAALGMQAGFDELLALAAADREFASAAIAAGGLRAEHVPWLVRVGIRRLHLGACVRPGGSWTKAHVDAGFVRSWRRLLDDALSGSARASDAS